MTEHPTWSDAEIVELVRWHDMEPVRHRYRITPSAMPTTNSKDAKR